MGDDECPMEGGVAPQPGLEYMPPNPPNMPGEMAYMEEGFNFDAIAEGAENYWGPDEWRRHYNMRRDAGASPEELADIKNKLRAVKHGHMQKEEEGESIIDADREDRMVDDLCKIRSIGSDFMKNLKIGEADMVPGRDSGFSESDVKEQIEQAARQARGYNERAEVVLELLMKIPKTVMNSWRRAGSPPPNTREFLEYLKEYLEVSDEMIAKMQQDNTARNERLYGKRKGVGENEGGTGWAGPMGDALSYEYDFKDEVAQLGAFVAEELKKHQK